MASQTLSCCFNPSLWNYLYLIDNWGSERLNQLPKVTRARIWTQEVFWFQALWFYILPQYSKSSRDISESTVWHTFAWSLPAKVFVPCSGQNAWWSHRNCPCYRGGVATTPDWSRVRNRIWQLGNRIRASGTRVHTRHPTTSPVGRSHWNWWRTCQQRKTKPEQRQRRLCPNWVLDRWQGLLESPIQKSKNTLCHHKIRYLQEPSPDTYIVWGEAKIEDISQQAYS